LSCFSLDLAGVLLLLTAVSDLTEISLTGAGVGVTDLQPRRNKLRENMIASFKFKLIRMIRRPVLLVFFYTVEQWDKFYWFEFSGDKLVLTGSLD